MITLTQDRLAHECGVLHKRSSPQRTSTINAKMDHPSREPCVSPKKVIQWSPFTAVASTQSSISSVVEDSDKAREDIPTGPSHQVSDPGSRDPEALKLGIRLLALHLLHPKPPDSLLQAVGQSAPA
jgi:hypothetical protein